MFAFWWVGCAGEKSAGNVPFPGGQLFLLVPGGVLSKPMGESSFEDTRFLPFVGGFLGETAGKPGLLEGAPTSSFESARARFLRATGYGWLKGKPRGNPE